MSKIILIMGETARGKDTLVKMLEKKGLKAVCSCTTRPKRECEVDGREHIFITDKEADELLAYDNTIVAKTQIGQYRYFATRGQLNGADIYIIDPNGAEYLLNKFDDIEPMLVYVTCDEHTALNRALNRGDDRNVVLSRISAEMEQFEGLESRFENVIRFDNDSGIEKLEEFADLIYKYYMN